jgi:hypothetical protein
LFLVSVLVFVTLVLSLVLEPTLIFKILLQLQLHLQQPQIPLQAAKPGPIHEALPRPAALPPGGPGLAAPDEEKEDDEGV